MTTYQGHTEMAPHIHKKTNKNQITRYIEYISPVGVYMCVYMCLFVCVWVDFEIR